jgi:hypothetical protein
MIELDPWLRGWGFFLAYRTFPLDLIETSDKLGVAP